MPNWCENELEIAGSENALKQFRDDNRARAGSDDEDRAELSFSRGVPEPDDYSTVDIPDSESPEWHYWRVKNWGCKWDACRGKGGVVQVGGSGPRLWYTFDTPWDPPRAWLAKVSKLYPELELMLLYWGEPGGRGFRGVSIARRGQLHESCEKADLFCEDIYADMDALIERAREAPLCPDECPIDRALRDPLP